MVEQARRARDAAEEVERQETEAALAKPDDRQSLGTLGDLLSKSRKRS
jgi:hypothetical protein